ncbi:BI1-like protein [Quillaja saponaria]|uniref:BI1-like protein n=1 Tax=Quillaja saponaria TaxID=32244 RepID=A0AAD7L1N1_QUISA|nr:BI1-like protein [Quillaja saponaria]
MAGHNEKGSVDIESGGNNAGPLYPSMLESPQLRWSFIRKPGLAIYVISLILPLILLCPLYVYHKHHPVNLILLMLFTISTAFLVGLTCAHVQGRVILEAVILTSAVVVSLTLYTFWAVKRGHDFQFLGPFLFGSLVVLLVAGFIQIFFPFGKISVMIYSCLSSIIFCGFIIYDTDNLIKRFSYDEYIWASVSLYLDVINLFLAILIGSDAANSN